MQIEIVRQSKNKERVKREKMEFGESITAAKRDAKAAKESLRGTTQKAKSKTENFNSKYKSDEIKGQMEGEVRGT